jgi:hypothetical protein
VKKIEVTKEELRRLICEEKISEKELNEKYTTSHLADLSGLFRGCDKLKNVPFFNTSNVLYMNGMFEGCTSLESTPQFATSSVIDMTDMFRECSSLTSTPIFDTSSLIYRGWVFEGCSSLDTNPEILISKYKVKPRDIKNWFENNTIMQEKYPEYFI